MKQSVKLLQRVADGLEKCRETHGVCPSQSEGISMGMQERSYCPLYALKCEHQGREVVFHAIDKNGKHDFLAYRLCKYTGNRSQEE